MSSLASPSVLVADLVESVRLLRDAEAEVIARWERLVGRLRAEWLPRTQGRLVKSLGDGLMLTFPSARQALRCAAELLDAMASLNEGQPPTRHMALRIGLHVTPWVEGELDIYGDGVNLCARLAALAQPQTVTLSNEALQAFGLQLPEGWKVQDLGRCYLKHVSQPVQCWQLRSSRSDTTWVACALDALRPRMAVLPIHVIEGAELPDAVTEVLRDDLVRALAANPHWQVVSRLSSAALQQAADLDALAQDQLWVHARLGGDPQGAELDLCLLDGRQELWSAHFEMSWQRLLSPEAGLMQRVVSSMDQALLRQGGAVAHEAALPNIPSYSLLLRAVHGLHRLRPETMATARQQLEHLLERHPRASDVQAWLAKWHFLALCQGLTSDPADALFRARESAERALQLDPHQGVALTVRGQLLAYAERDCVAAMQSLGIASERSPNEPMAWMYLSNLQAMEELPAALDSYNLAQALSPLDPLGFEIDMMGSIANLSVGNRAEALRLARRSAARNPLHLSSQSTLMIALVENGLMDEAREVAAAYLQRRPKASVQRYMDLHIAAGRPIVRRQGEALLAAGLPL